MRNAFTMFSGVVKIKKKILTNFFLTTFHLLSCQDASIFLVYTYSKTFFVANVSSALAFIVHAKDIHVIIIGNKTFKRYIDMLEFQKSLAKVMTIVAQMRDVT